MAIHCCNPRASVLKTGLEEGHIDHDQDHDQGGHDRVIHPFVGEDADFQQREVLGARRVSAQQFGAAQGDKGHCLGKFGM